MSTRPDYTGDIDRAGSIIAAMTKHGIVEEYGRGDWGVSPTMAPLASALALTSIALSLNTLTRQLADLRPALTSELLDGIASSVQSIDTQIGGSQ